MSFLVLLAVVVLIFLRMFWRLIAWEIAWDIRLLEFGLLCGGIGFVAALLWFSGHGPGHQFAAEMLN